MTSSANDPGENRGGPAAGPLRLPGPPPEEWRQRVGVLCMLPAVLRERGVDPASVLAEAGLPADALDGPERWVPFEAAVRALAVAARMADCPEIGVRVGQRFSLAQIGLLGELIRNSENVGAGLESYAVHQRLYSQGFAPHLAVSGGQARFGFVVYHPHVHAPAATYDVLLAAAAVAIRELCGAGWKPEAVHLPREQPRDAGAYREHFRCRLRFDADHAEIVLPARDLDRPIAGADPVRRRAVEAEIARQFDGNLVPLLYRSLRVMLLEGDGRIPALAQEFSMHRRTLARRLRLQGTRFRAVLDDVRYEVARGLLLDTGLPVTHIAGSLGYADATAFTRAFRRWSGASPVQWRMHHKVAGEPKPPRGR